MMRKILILLLLISVNGRAQLVESQADNSPDFYNLSLEELMNVRVSVASIKALTTREAPGIVTLITEEEIKNSGARDLMELLNTIPGFDFGVDVEGVIGMAVRGNWAHEGKILLLIDGQEMNENLFSSTQFGNHYPIENIRQIEIIRGPGSAMYGGYAEYAVINMISRSGEEINGLSVSARTSATNRGFSDSRGSICTGKKWKNFSFSLSGYSGFSERSDRTYEDFDGNSYSMKGNSDIQNHYANAELEYKKFRIRFISDIYRLQTRDNYTTATSKPYTEHFDSYILELKKDISLSPKFKLYPRVSYKRQLPWQFTGNAENNEMEPYHIGSEKLTGKLSAGYDPSEKLSVQSGFDVSDNKATDYQEGSYFNNGEKTIQLTNKAAFLQSVIRLGFADFTVGARYNFSNLYKPSFLPRIGITRVYKKFHVKCLYSQAFRLPSIENINYGTDIQPEKTSVLEIEGGLLINEKMVVTLNAFDIRTNNTIVYYYDVFNDEDSYVNFSRSGTRGIELVYKIKDRWGWAEFNYAYYKAGNHFNVENYRVEQNDQLLLGLPAHKMTLKGCIKIHEQWNISPSMTFSSARYGCIGFDAGQQNILKRYPESFTAGIYLLHDDFMVKGLDLAAGVSNITNSKIQYLQPYNSYHPPIPGQSREFTLKLTYHMNL